MTEFVIYVKDKATMRKFPNHNSPKLFGITEGEILDVVEVVNGTYVANSDIWFKVVYKNVEGYVHSGYCWIT